MLHSLTEKQCFWLSTLPPVLLGFFVLYILNSFPEQLLVTVCSVLGIPQPKITKKRVVHIDMSQQAEMLQNFYRLHQRLTESLPLDRRRAAREFERAAERAKKEMEWAAKSAKKEMTRAAKSAKSACCMGGESSGSEEEDAGRKVAEDSRAVDQALFVTDDSGAGKEGEKISAEIVVKLAHLSWTSLIPVMLLCLYFWEAAFMHREALVDFPLEHCMDADNVACFYIEQPYNMFKWPVYERLGCRDMLKKTIEDERAFFFVAPEQAKFYKCYTLMLSSANLIGSIGDVAVMLAIAFTIILYSCVHRLQTGMTVEEIKAQRCKIRWLYQTSAVALGLACGLALPHIYGIRTNDFMGYLGGPGLSVFLVIMFGNRRDVLLEEQLKAENLEELDEDSDSPTSPDSPGLGREASSSLIRGGYTAGHLVASYKPMSVMTSQTASSVATTFERRLDPQPGPGQPQAQRGGPTQILGTRSFVALPPRGA